MSFKWFLNSGLLSVAALGLLALMSSGASAATLNVVGGQLVGASGVDVGGTLYDVEFIDGTCIALFDGCDSAADFTFTTAGDALAASLALLDQVFQDVTAGNFDTSPDLTAGCTSTTLCAGMTVYSASPMLASVSLASNSFVVNTP